MEQDGQAETGPGTIDDLAQFLVDNPTADTEEEEQIQTDPDQDPDNPDGDPDAPVDPDKDDPSDPAEPDKQTSGLKFKVPVKGEDGSDTTIEVDEKELIAGYQRHADYTRKTQQLADKEREVTQQVAQKLDEGRTHYLQQAQLARVAVLQLAGLKSPQEMAQLAQADPSAWVVEQQRTSAVQSVLAQLEQGMSHEMQQLQAKQREEASREASRAWGVLGQQGIDKAKLQGIFDGVSDKYGLPKDRVYSVTDPVVIQMMRDALELRALKERKAEVTAKAKKAPTLPQRQSVPKNEQRNQQLNRRFASGKAKLNDLAAFIANNNL